ncbi:MAG: M24 family metallopeptidase, partial [Leptospiraceae bacterium]|nr:M24 family metallopeptidase [Leptospiraceae bacterium]
FKRTKKAIQMVRKGNKFWDIHKETIKNLVIPLKDMGFFQESVDEILEKELYKKFYMHKTGHWLGMDVHDVGKYYENSESRILENGMVLTIEPGLSFDPDDEAIPSEFRGIGIRIEDDILVNEDTPINLTSSIPKEIEEIENLRK